MTTIENTRQLPQRWQRSRKKGAKQPPNTRYCGRHNGYNPFASQHNIERLGKKWYVWADTEWIDFDTQKEAHAFSVVHFRRDMTASLEVDPEYFDELLGYDYLSCFCPLDMPCHVDVIIEHLAKRSESRKMSVLDKVFELFRVYELSVRGDGKSVVADAAEAELAQMRERIEALSESDRLLKLAREHITDDDLLHQIKWYMGETDIPYHPMPEDMK